MRIFVQIMLSAALTASCAVFVDRAFAEDYECRGPLDSTTITGKLLVPDDATCTLNGTHVHGDVVVKSRATLRATGVAVTGSVQAESPRTVVVTSSVIGNNFSVQKSEPAGLITLTDSKVGGDVQLGANQGTLAIKRNKIVGSLQASKNATGVEIRGNAIGNGLQCQNNRPAPTGADNVAKQKQGQCRLM